MRTSPVSGSARRRSRTSPIHSRRSSCSPRSGRDWGGPMIGDLLAASRPLSWINTAYPFAAAYLLATREVDLWLIVGTLFFLIPYNLAMYGINDVFDYASDLANPRKGGVEGAMLAPETHRTVLFVAAGVCVPFVVALVIAGTPVSWLVLAISLFAVVAYSAPPFRFKEIPVL